MALELLQLEPARGLLVAARPWDLRAAAELGLATAYIARPVAVAPASTDTFDAHASELTSCSATTAAMGQLRIPRPSREASPVPVGDPRAGHSPPPLSGPKSERLLAELRHRLDHRSRVPHCVHADRYCQHIAGIPDEEVREATADERERLGRCGTCG